MKAKGNPRKNRLRRRNPAVWAAKKKRGRDIDRRLGDVCRNCLNFQPPHYCPLQGYTTAEGLCALHDRAASDVEQWNGSDGSTEKQ